MFESDQEPNEQTPAHETSVRRAIARDLAGLRRHAASIAHALWRLTVTIVVLYALSVIWLVGLHLVGKC
jgi:hypothetical protein